MVLSYLITEAVLFIFARAQPWFTPDTPLSRDALPSHECSAIAHKYIYRPLPPTRNTRVLLLQPNNNRSAVLSCLEEMSMDAADKVERCYNALSYVWGSKICTQPLLCDCQTVLFTPNCESALRHLRDKRKEASFWVDAICINQEDLAERAQQVPLMGDIYRRAFEVIIWLGEETDSTSRYFSHTRTFINFKMLDIFRYALELIVLRRSPCWMLGWVVSVLDSARSNPRARREGGGQYHSRNNLLDLGYYLHRISAGSYWDGWGFSQEWTLPEKAIERREKNVTLI